MIIDMTELHAINSFFGLESIKGVYGLIWLLVPIFAGMECVLAQSKYGFGGGIFLYLGGWNLSLPYIFLPHFEIYEVAYSFLFISITTRWTLPRIRMDQLLNLWYLFL
ncbi:hypothetical protein MKX03_011553 [Papaver bracteatum]|nr:hypothetical protein MKX03_011553 [Papaver bracteatum]